MWPTWGGLEWMRGPVVAEPWARVHADASATTAKCVAAAGIDTEVALEVIRYFDALVERHAAVDELVQATAELAECAVGLDIGGQRVWSGLSERRRPASAGVSSCVDFDVDGTKASLWLERMGHPAPVDGLVLERAAVAIKIRLSERGTPIPAPADTALIQTVVSSRATTEDRCQALSRLGLAPDEPLRVVVVSVDGEHERAAAEALVSCIRSARCSGVAVVAGSAVVLIQPRRLGDSTVSEIRSAAAHHALAKRVWPGLRVGVGSRTDAVSADKSWEQAVAAMRFALTPGGAGYLHHAGETIIEYGELGALALLAAVPTEVLMSHSEIAALNAMAATDVGALDISAIEAFFRTGSLRSAAQVLHVHHSTVAARLERVQQVMGWRLDEPVSRFGAEFALLTRRLTQS
jgi:hypothetical protein